MPLNREQILSAPDLPTKEVLVPSWGGSVLVRGMTGAERDKWSVDRDRAEDEQGDRFDNITAAYLARCIVDEQGQPLFSADDAVALGQKSGAALKLLWDAVFAESALGPDGMEKALGNSEGAPSADSGSNSA